MQTKTISLVFAAGFLLGGLAAGWVVGSLMAVRTAKARAEADVARKEADSLRERLDDFRLLSELEQIRTTGTDEYRRALLPADGAQIKGKDQGDR
jgi:hypothetical protein